MIGKILLGSALICFATVWMVTAVTTLYRFSIKSYSQLKERKLEQKIVSR